MTDKELKKLNRRELLEILYYMRKELDETKTENERLQKLVDESNKDHEEIMTALNKAMNKINKLCSAQFGDNIKSKGDDSHKSTKSNNKRKQKRRTEKGGK